MPIFFDQDVDSGGEYELSPRPRLRSRSNADTRTLHPSLRQPISSDAPGLTPAEDAADDAAGSEDEYLNVDDIEATHSLLRSKGTARTSHTTPGILSVLVGFKERFWPAIKNRTWRIFGICGVRRYHGLRKRLCQLLVVVIVVMTLWVSYVLLFAPSYAKSRYPRNYQVIEESVRKGGGINELGYWRSRTTGEKRRTVSGRGNPDGEKVFIAANIINAELISGWWGEAVVELIDLLGEENVFLSIFENDSGPATTAALNSLSSLISTHLPTAHHSILSTTLPLSNVPRVTTPDGDSYVKRIAYLAEVRNRAILPLVGSIPSLSRWDQNGHAFPRDESEEEKPAMPTNWVQDPKEYKKVLFLNDVVFDPLEAVHLLFSTNEGNFAAACGMDFVNPFKYYDTFATRDITGSSLGVPFFPFFTPSPSRAAILSGADSIPVKSCWGGIVAFDAGYFITGLPATPSSHPPDSDGDDDDDTEDDNHESDRRSSPVPLRFRSSEELYWEASECCLIHADVDEPQKTFINPFIRVAYDAHTFSWLPTLRRIERVFAGLHGVIVWALKMPWGGLRKREVEGEVINERQWDGHNWVQRERIAGRGGYCGSPMLLVMTEREDEAEKGKRGWKRLEVPKEG